MALTLPPLDSRAVRAGAVLALIVAVPAALAGEALEADRPADHPSGWALLLSVVVFLGLLAGAALAAFGQRKGTPLIHGIVVALGCFIAVQAVGVVRRSIQGDTISWSRILSSALLSAMAGTIGGLLGNRVPRPPETVT